VLFHLARHTISGPEEFVAVAEASKEEVVAKKKSDGVVSLMVEV
jgi:hypothetical protein